ncbi:MAG: hypothetical protein Q7R34_10045, partial [Dehalococcoidia bacterium]|nr:hypothetical protein [Dehalococcoidia bacterium]
FNTDQRLPLGFIVTSCVFLIVTLSISDVLVTLTVSPPPQGSATNTSPWRMTSIHRLCIQSLPLSN